MESFGGEDGEMGLSVPIEAAVSEAIKVIESLVERILKGELKSNILETRALINGTTRYNNGF